jgi:hypothetical protein
MRYDEFRDRLQEALREAGLLLFPAGSPDETLDLANAGRKWEGYTLGSPPRDPAPFHVSAKIAFAWDAVNTARAQTCEEDVLMKLLGRRQRNPRTQPRWTRVDLELYASLPYGSTTPMPDAQLFGPWAGSTGETLSGLLTEFKERDGQVVEVTGACEDIAVEARVSPDGVLSLKGLSVSGFRIARIPRVWDDPARREAEKDIAGDLAALARRFKNAFDAWAGAAADLAGWMRYTPPPAGAAPLEPRFEDEGGDDDPETIH